MGTVPVTYTGEDATISLYTNAGTQRTHSDLAISDFSLTIARGTAEQPLVGSKGNYFLAGARSIEGSLTACRIHNTALGSLIENMIDGNTIRVSGNTGTNSLHFYLKSCQVTGFDFSIGPADEITEGTIDFAVLYPYRVSSVQYISAQNYSYISDFENHTETGSGTF